MDFIDIINQFNLKIKMKLENVNEQILPHFKFIDNQLPIAYDETNIILDKLRHATSEYNKKLVDYVNKHEALVQRCTKEFSKINLEMMNGLDSEVSNLTSALQDKKTDTSLINKQLEEKKYLEKIKSRDILNDRDIEKNLANNDLLQITPSFYKKYNQKMIVFTNIKNENNSYLHASTSKKLYSYKEANHSLKEHLKERIEEVKEEISILNEEIEKTSIQFKEKHYQETILYNQHIHKLTNETKNKTRYMDTRISVDENFFNNRRDSAIKHYEEQRLDILANKEKELKELQIEKELSIKIYLENREKILSRYEILLFKLEQNLNRTIKENYKKEQNASWYIKYRVFKSNQSRYKLFVQKKKELSKLLYLNEKSYLTNLERLKYQEFFIELETNKKLDSLSTYEKVQQYRFDLDYKLILLKKDTNNKRISNTNQANTNKAQAAFEIKKLEIENEYKKYELNKKIELEAKYIELLNLESDLTYSAELEELVTEKEQQDEKLLTIQNDVISLLNIEKNKYLASFNEETIDHKINTNTLNYAYFRRDEEFNLSSILKRLDENINFNNLVLKNFSELTDLEIQARRINFRNVIEMSRFKRDESIVKSRTNLHFNKLQLDINYMNALTQSFYTIYKIYKTIFSNSLKNITNYIKNNLTNSEFLILEVKDFSVIFTDFYIELINFYTSSIQKIIDNRIHFELGSKYDNLIEQVKKTYEDSKKRLTDRKTSFERTILNYRSTIHHSFAMLQDLNRRKIQATENELNEIIQIDGEIIRYNNLIKKNYKSIHYLNKRIAKFPKAFSTIDNNYKQQINKITHKKENETVISTQAIEYFEHLKQNATEELKHASKAFDFNQVLIYKNLFNNLKEFETIMTNNTYELYKKYLSYIKTYFGKENKNLSRIKNRYDKSFKDKYDAIDTAYKRDLSALNINLSYNKDALETIKKNNEENYHYINETLQKDVRKSRKIYNNDLLLENQRYEKITFDFDTRVCALEQNIEQMKNKISRELEKNNSIYQVTSNNLRNRENQNKIHGKTESQLRVDEMKYNLHILPNLLKIEVNKLKSRCDELNKDLKNQNKNLKDKVNQQARDNSFEAGIRNNEAKKTVKNIERNYEHERKITKKRLKRSKNLIDRELRKKYEI